MKKGQKDNSYINKDIKKGFLAKRDDFNYKKLIGLLSELNSNYTLGNTYASMMLVRAVLDHVPPLLGYDTFEEIVNNYSWSRTDKKYMKSLMDFKNEADDALHRPISGDDDFLDIDSLPKRNRVNRLLEECLKVGGTIKPKQYSKINKQVTHSNIKIKLAKETIRWANFSTSRGVWSSFKVDLEIDNYRSNKPDYISVSVRANLLDGSKWIGNHYIFNKTGELDEEFWINKNEVKKPFIFISSHPPGGHRSEPMPEISNDPIEIHVNTRSSAEFKFLVPRSKVIKR